MLIVKFEFYFYMKVKTVDFNYCEIFSKLELIEARDFFLCVFYFKLTFFKSSSAFIKRMYEKNRKEVPKALESMVIRIQHVFKGLF